MTRILWRGSLLPLGCEAAPKSLASRLFCDCCAAEREQAPSPQGLCVRPWPASASATPRNDPTPAPPTTAPHPPFD
ncbi:hypothetical protein EAH78_28340 [Pseudomonas arsenicoxydans]|uniref:Uncharacterized protein n=1 Tax=Pseudomonas arsenicoxydans TaxID=702115 RepID=A0A502HCR0_9PSED|nr:hypothetical protein EAH78_28340 [Pseudomonas arsenicoxydans]